MDHISVRIEVNGKWIRTVERYSDGAKGMSGIANDKNRTEEFLEAIKLLQLLACENRGEVLAMEQVLAKLKSNG